MTLTNDPFIPDTCVKWWKELPLSAKAWLTIALLELKNMPDELLDWKQWVEDRQARAADNPGSDPFAQIESVCLIAGLHLLNQLIVKDIQ